MEYIMLGEHANASRGEEEQDKETVESISSCSFRDNGQVDKAIREEILEIFLLVEEEEGSKSAQCRGTFLSCPFLQSIFSQSLVVVAFLHQDVVASLATRATSIALDVVAPIVGINMKGLVRRLN